MTLRSKFYGKTICSLLTFSALLLAPWAVGAHELLFVAHRAWKVKPNQVGWFIQIMATIEGGTAMRLETGPGQWEDFENTGPDHFDIESPIVESLADLNDLFARTYNLEIERGSEVSRYQFTGSELALNLFPDFPLFQTTPDDIPVTYTFSWQWSGDAMVKVINYGSHDGSVEWEYVLFNGDPGFADLSHDVDFGTDRGRAEFSLMYARELALTDFVSQWQHVNGPDIFEDGDVKAFTASGAELEFEVIPEPSSLGLIAALAACRLGLSWRGCRMPRA